MSSYDFQAVLWTIALCVLGALVFSFTLEACDWEAESNCRIFCQDNKAQGYEYEKGACFCGQREANHD